MNDLNPMHSREVAVRSLLRRLWRAFQQEDEAAAIRAYTATRADYFAWIQQEQDEQARQEHRLVQQQQQQQKTNSKKWKLKRRGSNKHTPKQQEYPVLCLDASWDDADDQTPLLQTKLNPSRVFVADDCKSPNDPYPDLTPAPTPTTTPRRSRKKTPRFAGFWSQPQHVEEETNNSMHSTNTQTSFATTPLHEAARMASSTLVRLFLQHQDASPNVKNGLEQTSLILAAGGLTQQEAHLLQQQEDEDVLNVGIRIMSMEESQEQDEDKTNSAAAVGAKKAALAVVRLFRGTNPQHDNVEALHVSSINTPCSIPFDKRKWQALNDQRMDTVLAILSWSSQNGSSNDGPSINSVDERGRTALHYAAELGRVPICMAIVSAFGAILTIVDESSRTPCELAGEQGHAELAAQLEARALLYADPYGVDDELMASVLSEQRHNDSKLVMPFSWFETWSTVQVRQERLARTEKALVEVQKILVERQEQTKANQVIYNYDVNDSIDSVIDATGVGVGVLLTDQEFDDEANDAGPSIQDDHPPSPPFERADDGITNDEGNVTNQTLPAKQMTEEHDNVADDLSAFNEASNMDDKGSPSEVDSVYTRLLNSIQESHIERYLTFHNWDSDTAFTEFKTDPMQALADAGVSVENKTGASLKWEESPQTCLICFETFDPNSSEWTQFRGCGHGFCTQCVGDYIVDCAQSRSGGITVTCPHHECDVPLTQSELQSMVPSPTVYESLLEAADENFVASGSDVKFCPHPGCEGVVHRLVPAIVQQEGFPRDITDICGAVCVSFPEGVDDAPLTYEGVRDRRCVMTRGSMQPHKAHRFCFACGDDTIHWPVTCETLEQWKAKIRDEIGEVKEEGEGNYEDVAQRLWMKANTRPCPKCKVPIEKNEGCNHMTCTNRHCRHEFCWICRKDWKLHNSETGGFFRCNRWEGEENHEFYDGEEHKPRPRPENEDDAEGNEGSRNDHEYGSAVHASRVAFKKSTEMKRFLHHFSRWSAHKESSALEQNMADTACSRLAPVVEAAVEFNGSSDFDFGGKGLSFVHAAFTELLECRSLLQHSYAFAFFRYPTLYYIRRNRVVKLRQREKATFEQFQSELEMMTEQMSDIVARTHLRATQTQIMFLTSEAAEKRCDFSSFLLAVMDDERREKAAKERQERENENPNQAVPAASIPPPLDISGIIERLQSRTPLTNVHNDMDSDDGIGVSYPRVSRLQQRLDEDEELEQDTAMQEALRASLVTYNAESGTSYSAASSGDEEPSTTEWACEACTFVNSRAVSCGMCGTVRTDQGIESDSSSESDDDGDEEDLDLE